MERFAKRVFLLFSFPGTSPGALGTGNLRLTPGMVGVVASPAEVADASVLPEP
jgi:hypothetical protein